MPVAEIEVEEAVDARTIADLLRELGDIPPNRVRLKPLPGKATVNDVVEIEARENRLFELVDGTLVEKAMGFRESVLALALSHWISKYVSERNLGVIAGPDGMMEIISGLVRMPDVAFISWSRLPDGKVPSEPVPNIAPELAIEILSRSNTRQEMTRKRREYFRAGVQLVWEIDPERKIATIFTSAETSKVVTESEILDGGPVLPGFALKLGDLFAELEKRTG